MSGNGQGARNMDMYDTIHEHVYILHGFSSSMMKRVNCSIRMVICIVVNGITMKHVVLVFSNMQMGMCMKELGNTMCKFLLTLDCFSKFVHSV